MIIVCNRIPVNMAHSEAFEEAFANRANRVDGMPGFITFQMLRPTAEGDPYIVQTFWEDKASYEAWVNSDEFNQGHAQSSTLPKDVFLGRPKIEVHEVIQSTAKIVRE